MRIELVRPFGFCSGVKRATEIVKDTLKKRKNCFSFGPIIHNSYVTKDLSKRGLKLIEDLNLLKSFFLLFLPTHGTSPELIKRLKNKNIEFIDLICPYVASVHRICKNLKRRGFKIFVLGDRKHTEIKALEGVIRDIRVIDREPDLLDNNLLQKIKKVGVISQTTQSKDKYLQIVSSLMRKYIGVKEFYLFNTICPDCLRRQEEIKRIAERVDLMVIVGDKVSANTRSLYRTAKKINKNSYHIENQEDLGRLPKLENLFIGIASGASTPKILVRKIIRSLKDGRRSKITL